MFKCCKKDDVGPAPVRLSSYREEGSASRRSTSSEVRNMSMARRRLTDVSNLPTGRRSGLYDMSSIQLPPLPPRSASYREGGSSSARSTIGDQPTPVLTSSRSYHGVEAMVSASRRKSDVGSSSTWKSNVESTSRRRSNVVDEHLAFPYQTSPPTRIDRRQAYIDQCNRCACVALDHFNSSLACQWGGTYELVDIGVSVGFMHRIRGVVYHSNFHAKPTNSPPSAPTMLFFAELYEIYPNPPQVNTCGILGPTGFVLSGPMGCQACSGNPDRPALHHPSCGSFDVGEQQCLLFEDDGISDDDIDYYDDDYDNNDDDDDED